MAKEEDIDYNLPFLWRRIPNHGRTKGYTIYRRDDTTTHEVLVLSMFKGGWSERPTPMIIIDKFYATKNIYVNDSSCFFVENK